MKTKLLITALALTVMATLANAQTNATSQSQDAEKSKATVQTKEPGNGRGQAYIDNNRNGVCDNYENGTAGYNMSKKGSGNDAAGNGNGQRMRKGHGMGNRNGCCKGNGKTANGMNRGQGKNFVDKNNNGICDNRESTETKK